MRGRTWKLVIYIFLLGFILNLAGIVSHVVVSAFAKRWFGKPLPPAFTTDWFTYAWTNFELGQVLFITLFIALAVVFIALAIGFPAAYILARRNFRAKPILLLLYFLPLLIPQMTYGIPLATTLYKFGVGGTVPSWCRWCRSRSSSCCPSSSRSVSISNGARRCSARAGCRYSAECCCL
jgi:putative spermidine/putrescine transport system permease protein